MSRKKIVFLGSKPIGYNCLAYLVAQKDVLNIEITGLLTQARKEFGTGHDLSAIAKEHNIPLFNNPSEIPACDIMYSVQYHHILKQAHIDRATQIAVNLHMAPLPEYRGSNQFSFAIIDGKQEFGTTIHQVDEGIDHGDILFQKRFPIPEGCWVDELYQLTYNASLNLFKQTLAHIVKGTYSPVPQQLLVARYGTSLHYRKEMDALKVIDMSWDQEKIARYVRATFMPGFEPPYYIKDGAKVHFTR